MGGYWNKTGAWLGLFESWGTLEVVAWICWERNAVVQLTFLDYFVFKSRIDRRRKFPINQ